MAREEFRGSRTRERRGLTYVEMLVVLAVLTVLAAAAIPLLGKMDHWMDKRMRERQLRLALQTMRDAIDQYKTYSDEGLIPMIEAELDQMGYPESLEALVEGVSVGAPGSPDEKKVSFLYTIPVDPFTGQAEWGYRSYQDDWDSTSWGGQNVYDVYSLSDLVALDGTYYRDW